MIYIEKKGLSDGLNQKIIEIRKSDTWKAIEEDDTEAIRNVFNNDFPKNEVKKVLIHEQHGLCAYCMKRIRMDAHSRVEHFMPLSRDKEKALDYSNMLGVCDGGEKSENTQGHILCCDAHKAEKMISTSPLNKIQMDKIAYDTKGRIYTEPKDDSMETDINEVLMLNGVRKKDGSAIDTSTEILKGRQDAYKRAKRMLNTLNGKRKCSSASVKKIMDEMLDKEEWEEYIGVKLYYFNKRYKSLIRRGM